MPTNSDVNINDFIVSHSRKPEASTLQKITDLATRRFDLANSLSDLSERVTDANKAIRDLDFKLLPEAMVNAGIDSLSIPSQGNRPSFALALVPYYKAVIQVGWDTQRREEAFAVLERYNLADLIRTEVTVSLPAGNAEEAQALMRAISALGHTPTAKKTVPWMTLTAAIKEMYERGGSLSDAELEALGATVAQIAELKVKVQRRTT